MNFVLFFQSFDRNRRRRCGQIFDRFDEGRFPAKQLSAGGRHQWKQSSRLLSLQVKTTCNVTFKQTTWLTRV